MRRTVLFEISYRDHCCGEIKTIEATFDDTPGILAFQWAQDYAYTLANKGWYRVTQLNNGE